MKNYEYIFFDLDGTLSDSAPGIINAVLYSLDKMGVHESDTDKLTCFVGPPLNESFPKYYGFSGDDTENAIKYFREYYRESGINENSMYPGIPEVLDALLAGGKKLAVATSKPEVFARRIIERYGIANRFEFIGGSVFDESRVTKAEVVSYCMETLGITDASRVLMVGDRSHDVEGAMKCGVDCMGVLHGYGSREELVSAGAKYIAETVADIADMILE